MASASTTVAPAGSTTSRRIGSEVRVDLDGGDVGTGLQQRQRERPEPGADLDDWSPGPTPASRDDPPHRVGIGHEVLPSARDGASPCAASSARIADGECVTGRSLAASAAPTATDDGG